MKYIYTGKYEDMRYEYAYPHISTKLVRRCQTVLMYSMSTSGLFILQDFRNHSSTNYPSQFYILNPLVSFFDLIKHSLKIFIYLFSSSAISIYNAHKIFVDFSYIKILAAFLPFKCRVHCQFYIFIFTEVYFY